MCIRDRLTRLADTYHLVAPDYPGFGHSDWPDPSHFPYTFDHIAVLMDHFTEALALSHYTLYMQDYGAPVGFRMILAHPDRAQALIAVSYTHLTGPDVLNRDHDSRRKLVLNAQTVLQRARVRIVVAKGSHARREDGQRSLLPVDGARRGVAEVHLIRQRLISEGRIGVGPVDIVALHALVEDSTAAAQNRFAGAKQIVGEAQSRFIREVIVLDQTARESVFPG